MLLKKLDPFVGSVLTRILPAPAGVGGGPADIRRLLVIRPGGIGDAVLLIPTLRALRKAYPLSVIHVLAERRNASIFRLSPEVDKLYCYDRMRDLLSVFLNSYDVVIDTEQWHRLSAVVARLVRSPIKIGYGTNDRKRLLTHYFEYSHDRYEADSFFALLRPLMVESPALVSFPFLTIPSALRASADRLLGESMDRPFVTLFPGASIEARRWGSEKFHEVARGLAGEGLSVVVVGGEEDCAAGDAIVAGIGGLNLAGKTSLCESAAVIDRSILLVSGDSGILHIGAGLGKPTVSLFGPGIAKKWAPRGETHIVISKSLPCSPCTKFGYTPKCPIGAKCMRDITVDEVFHAVVTLLQRTQAQKAN